WSHIRSPGMHSLGLTSGFAASVEPASFPTPPPIPVTSTPPVPPRPPPPVFVPPAPVPAAPDVPAVPAVPAVPDVPAAPPPVPPSLVTALIEPQAAAHKSGRRRARRPTPGCGFAIKPTVLYRR